jgi:hypothetical protein
MDEEKKAQEVQAQAEGQAKEAPAQESQKVSVSTKPASQEEQVISQSPLEEARALDKSIKAGNAEYKSLLDRQEKILADSQMAGKGLAGQPQATPENVMKKQRAMEAWKGTDVAKAIEKHG